MHQYMTQHLAEQHRRDLMREAEAWRAVHGSKQPRRFRDLSLLWRRRSVVKPRRQLTEADIRTRPEELGLSL
jgi:hypothetical protein